MSKHLICLDMFIAMTSYVNKQLVIEYLCKHEIRKYNGEIIKSVYGRDKSALCSDSCVKEEG